MTSILGAFLLAWVLAPGAASVSSADPLPERAIHIADYDIRVTLDPSTHRLTGRQRLVWRNPSTDAVPDLWFHLYLNAFKNTRSTFWRESGGQLRGVEMASDGWGWIDVTRLALADGTDLTKSLRVEAPDDGNVDDQTVARVVLPRPVGAGEAVTLDIAFTAQLPIVFARTGYVRDYHLVAQWFPKLGVYEPAGMRGRTTGGWNCHQFHATSEFYADFGQYRVEITAPSHFVIGATGARRSSKDNGNGTTTHVYQQGNVHDFAWTASPQFVEQRRRFVASRAVTEDEYRRVADLLDRSLEQVRLTDVDVILLLQPDHRSQADQHFEAAMLALKWFGLWYGRYPYQTLTIVDPAPGAEGSGGMEYPTFFTAGTHVLLGLRPFQGVREPEFVTIHETGHQFWQGLVANNEFEEAWLDEGIDSYSTGKVLELAYGRETALGSFAGLQLSDVDLVRLQNGWDRRFDVIRKASWEYQDGDSYAFNSYTRPEMVLRTLEAHVGERVMARVMRTFHERWRFGHPSTDDFYSVVDEVAGRDLRPLLVQMFETGALFDYEVGPVSSERAPPPIGFVETPRGRQLLASDRPEAQGGTMYDTSVIVRRRGDLVVPVEIAFKFEGRPPERVTWDGAASWRRYQFTRPERLEWVDIDPDRRFIYDVNWMKNAYRLEPDHRAAASLGSRWLFLLQQLLSWVAL